MMREPKYSVIIPVYNRPLELDELLESLTYQTLKDFDVTVVEDGSTVLSDKVVEKYSDRLTLQYLYKPNSGPGPSRNFGFSQARGEYFIVFDSDCIIPPGYVERVNDFLTATPLDAWGGPDKGHKNFSILQRAMAYTMSSVLTTGGIRGNKNQANTFQPRSFNMGMTKEAFKKTGGFKFDRHAEDIELSIRMKKLGLRVGLIAEAFVFHKRRIDFAQFFEQVAGFGKGRVLVGRAHPGSIKMTHWFPALFLIGLGLIPILLLVRLELGLLLTLGYSIFLLSVAIGGWINTKSIAVSVCCIPSALIQLCGYGYGFFREKTKSYT
jgi:glycosyltransferase involved in cell wall biosynthesis